MLIFEMHFLQKTDFDNSFVFEKFSQRNRSSFEILLSKGQALFHFLGNKV